METAVTFIILISCWTVCSVPTRQSFSFSMVFGPGTRLVVHVDEDFDADDDLLNHQNKSTGSSNTPSIQLLSSVRLSQDPRSAPLLVCLLTGLTSPQQHILWGLNDMVVTSVRPEQPWKKSKRGYSATSVREVSTADWKLTSSYWCGTMQGGKMYRQKLCSED